MSETHVLLSWKNLRPSVMADSRSAITLGNFALNNKHPTLYHMSGRTNTFILWWKNIELIVNTYIRVYNTPTNRHVVKCLVIQNAANEHS